MIKVITEFQAMDGVRILHQLRKLRLTAMNHPGYLSGETLVNTKDKNSIIIISAWQSSKDWVTWEESEPRNAVFQQIEPFLSEEPRVRICRYLSYQQAIKG